MATRQFSEVDELTTIYYVNLTLPSVTLIALELDDVELWGRGTRLLDATGRHRARITGVEQIRVQCEEVSFRFSALWLATS